MSRVLQGTFADRLRKLCAIVGGQRRFATLVGVAHPTITGWLSGSDPYESSFRKMAEKTKIPIEWLRDGRGDADQILADFTERRHSEDSGEAVHEDAPVYGAPGAATTIHDSIRFITDHGTIDDIRMLEDILIATRRRIQDRRRGS
jgi:hypothetical protein